MTPLKQWLSSLALIAAGCGALHAPAAAAEPWPTRPISVMVGFPAGGVVDVMARAVLNELSAELGQSIVVENRTGAGGSISVAAALAAPADGYTWLVSSNFVLVNPVLDPSVKWKTDQLQPVGRYALSPSFVLAPNNAPYDTLKEFVEHARQNPGLPYGDGGPGTTQTMGTQMLIRETGIKLESIYYQGAPQMLPDLANGLLAMTVVPSTVAIPAVQSKRVKALAVTGERRSPALPDVPTIGEAGFPTATAVSWYGIHVPKGTPQDVVERISTSLEKACSSQKVQDALRSAGGEAACLTTAPFATFVAGESERWLGLLKSGVATGKK